MFTAMLGLLMVVFYDGLKEMVRIWTVKDQYGHGFFIPVISLYLVWISRSVFEDEFKPSWTGVALVVAGLSIGLLGELSTIYVIVQYAFLITLTGVVLALTGWKITRKLWAPLVFLLFMIPLPTFLYNSLSGQLQLISSNVGVWVVRLFGISVYLEGNVIDLGTFKLQVVEACAGLKYLFSLTSIGFLCAYLLAVPKWKKVVIFLSSIPITIFMNSFRVGVTGVLVEYWGISMAEGFLHDFEGLAIFGAALGILLIEMAILARIGKHKTTLRDAFGVPAMPARSDDVRSGPGVGVSLTAATISVFVLLIGGLLFTQSITSREELKPARTTFTSFPDKVAGWKGKQDSLEQIYLDQLKLDDYVITNYRNDKDRVVNFYVAYYASQRKGQSAHSPRSCIPGGGWKMTELSTYQVPGLDKPLFVNRTVIKLGDAKQVVYYWFQQRGRNLTNEYMVKWYIFWDAMTKNRTDGALVRLTTPIGKDESVEDGDKRLAEFTREFHPLMGEYIPGE